MTAGIGVAIAIAFLAGIVSFASPCCLPLVPAYVGLHGRDRRRERHPPAAGPPSTRRSPSSLGFSARLHHAVGVDRARRLRPARLRRAPPPGRRRDPRLHGPPRRGRHRRRRALSRGPSPGRLDGRSLDGLRPGRARQPRATAGRPCSASSSPPAGRRASGRSSAGSSAWPRSARASREGTVLLVAYAAGLAIPFILVAVGATAVSHRLGWLRDHHRGGLDGDRRDARRWSAS